MAVLATYHLQHVMRTFVIVGLVCTIVIGLYAIFNGLNKNQSDTLDRLAYQLERISFRLDNLEKKAVHSEARLPARSTSQNTGISPYEEVPNLDYKHKLRILVTGGSGFVGSHLVEALLRQGHEVIALDNFFTGTKHNLEHWFGHPNFELVHHDIVNPYYIEVDRIYHLASPASPPHYMYNPVKTIKTNTVGTINVLGMARRVKARVLLASTSEVYGDPEVHPQPESYWGHANPIGPRSCYDESKRIAESLMVAYEKQESVSIRIARIFNTFGPRMHLNDGRVVSNFITQALEGRDMTIYGNGSQTRSLMYVTDLVDGLMALMESDLNTPVNIGGPKETTILEFAQKIKRMTMSESRIVYKPAVTDDPHRRKPDVTKARTELGWRPKIDVDEGLRRTIEYFKQALAADQSDTFRTTLKQLAG